MHKPLILMLLLGGCAYMSPIGRPPDMSAANDTQEYMAMMSPGLPQNLSAPPAPYHLQGSSLWSGERGSLLGDNRAIRRGDILTVVIEIDDSAAINNQTDRRRSADQSLDIGALFGMPERSATGGTPLNPAVELDSAARFAGQGSVRRAEELTMRVAATVIDVLPNGVLAISAQQEIRVNNELRELLVTGYVRPADISRQNEVSYDKIASARISYGGRGQITDMQQPRWGQQVLDQVLPF